LTLFGLRDRVTRKLVFFPPPRQYVVEDEMKGGQTMYLLDEGKQKSEPYSAADFRVDLVKCVPATPCASCAGLTSVCIAGRCVAKQLLPCEFACFTVLCAARWIGSPGSTTTILFSHGNATDIGLMRDHLLHLSAELNVNVYA
jgi:hypothetical protein